MSLFSKLAGIDPLIDAARRRDYAGVIAEVEKLLHHYAPGKIADEFSALAELLMPVVAEFMKSRPASN